MLRFLFDFNGSASRKDWWCITALTALILGGALLLPPHALLSAGCALLLLPWLAVSARRMHSTGNEAAPCLFSLAGVAILLLLQPLLNDSTREIAAPFLQLLLLIGGIVALSYAVICGFIQHSHRA